MQQKKSLKGPARSVPEADGLLLTYLQATDEVESHRLLTQLISRHAEPVIRSVIGYKLRVTLSRSGESGREDGDDIVGDVVLELLTSLHDLRRNPEVRQIRNFASYVAAIAHSACAEYLRKKSPLRSSLKNKVRYVLTRWPGFALWNNNSEWLCGFASWRDQELHARTTESLQAGSIQELFQQSMPSNFDAQQVSVPDLLAAIFNWGAAPIKFDDLVSAVAELCGIRDDDARQDFSPSRADGDPMDLLPDLSVNITTEVEQRLYLQRIWIEIAELPSSQRCALLLNLTDPSGNGVIALLPAIGIASAREIAQTLGMSVEHLADLWNDLPLDDRAIAEYLGVTRQQVINLRKAARERLARRTKAFASAGGAI